MTNNQTFPEKDRKLINVLCGDIGEGLYPFQEIAQGLDLTEEEVLAWIKKFLEEKTMRRFGAILFHQQAGFKGNGLTVWNVPEEQLDEYGKKLAGFSEISHCYARPKVADWPYNLYAMIHGRDSEQCREAVKRIAEDIGLKDYQVLFSGREFKKSSMFYFGEATQK